MTSKQILEYSLLRSLLDKRPLWAQRIGLHSFILNGEEIVRTYPRLKYKRKFGSHVVNPHADQSYKDSQEHNYYQCYLELSNL